MAIGVYKFRISFEHNGQTVKTYFRREIGLSARSMTVLKYAGTGITRRGVELRAHDILHTDDVVVINLPHEENLIEPVAGDLNILFEDDRLLIVNKPSSMPVHPTKIHQLDTLANIVAAYQKQKGEAYTFRALNRLDKDTSGIVLIVKDRVTYSLVQPTVQKIYYAVCEGIIRESGTVDMPITLEVNSSIKRCVRENGDRAITHYEPICFGNGHTLCRVAIETGRTHQIRCHMSHLGYPLAGDDLYGGSLRYIKRQALHCAEVKFRHPDTHSAICIKSEIPTEFSEILT